MSIKLSSAWNYAILLPLFSLLAACGGGGSDSAPAVTARLEGLYEGPLTGSTTNSVFRIVILDDGQYWGIYGSTVGGALLVTGFVQGQGASTNGAFSSTNLRDFGVNPAGVGSILGTYSPGQGFNATIVSGPATVTFTGAPVSNFNYNMAATVSAVSGNWNASTLTGSGAALGISSNGSFAVNSGGCITTGTLTPRLSGTNIFDVTATTGTVGCANSGVRVVGIALTYLLTTGQRQFLLTAVDPTRTQSVVLFALR